MSIQAMEDPDTLKEIYTNKNTLDLFVSKVLNNGLSLKTTEDPDTLKQIYTNILLSSFM